MQVITARSDVALLKDHQLPAPIQPRRCRHSPLDRVLGTSAGQWGGLLVIAALLVVIGASLWLAMGGDNKVGQSLAASLWFSWCLFIDPGTQTRLTVDDDMRAKFLVASLSTAGVLFNLCVLGKIVDYIRGQLKLWQRTRNRTSGNGHTVILGWSDKTVFLLLELLNAYEQQARSQWAVFGRYSRWLRRRVVILAKRPELQMAEEVKLVLGDEGISAHRIQFREGNPASRQELIRAGAPRAADVIVMGTSPHATKADQEVLRVVMALAALPKEDSVNGEVFAEVRLNQSADVVQEILPIADGIVARQAVYRTLCLCSLVPAVGLCYSEMMSFKVGSHLFLKPAPRSLWGLPFGQACQAFPHAVVLGLAQDVDGGLFHAGSSTLVPRRTQAIQAGDHLVLLATTKDLDVDMRSQRVGPATGDRVKAALSNSHLMSGLSARIIKHQSGGAPGPTTAPWRSVSPGRASLPLTDGKPKLVIMVGCPLDFPHLLAQLDLYLSVGSTVHILSEMPIPLREQCLQSADLANGGGALFDNLELQHHVGSTTSLHHLEVLPLETADCVLILAERNATSDGAAEADSRSLTTIITLRGLPYGVGVQSHCSVVCELLDIESEKVVKDNAELATQGIFFSSSYLETAVFAMAAESKAVYNILILLLHPQSNAGDIVSVPVRGFLNRDERLSFFELHARVWEASEGLLLGWRRGDKDPVLNPTGKAVPLSWNEEPSDEDLLLVVRVSREL